MIRYRLYTEDKGIDSLASLVSEHFDGFTIVKSLGYWKGQPEESLIIEIIGDESDEKTIKYIAKRIKKLNAQEAVYLTKDTIDGYLV